MTSRPRTLYGHVKARKRRGDFRVFLRYIRTLHPAEKRIAIMLDNFSPHLSTRHDTRVGDYAAQNNIELPLGPPARTRRSGVSRERWAHGRTRTSANR